MTKIIRDEGQKQFKFGGGKELESEEERFIYVVIAKLTQEVPSLKKENEILKYEIEEIKAGKSRQLKRQADQTQGTGG